MRTDRHLTYHGRLARLSVVISPPPIKEGPVSVEHGNGGIAAEQPVADQLPSPGSATVTRFVAPPLPDPVTNGEHETVAVEPVDEAAREPAASFVPLPIKRRLRPGCYLMRYTPTHHATTLLPPHYDGTLRVEREDSTNTIASGDLYLHQPKITHPFLLPKEPNPAAGIPIFPIANYRYYVRVTQILEGSATATQFTLGFELHRFDHATNTWSLEGPYTARMRWTIAPIGYPKPFDYLTGNVRNAAGSKVGVLTIGWVSRHLRRAIVEIDRVPASEPALANAAGVGWRELFEQVGWDVSVDESDANVLEPGDPSFSDAEMHATMLARRDSADLDRQWRYWLVCVQLLDSTSRGIMFDAFGGDSNNIPREGAGMSSHWVIPNADPWGLVKGMRFGTATDPYFRTGVHEIGHAMGLYHNTIDNGFMNTTDVIASNAVPPEQFPNNVQWSHAPDDQKRLRHMPDLWVRPGGVPFGAAYSTAPISPDDAAIEPDDIHLGVRAVLNVVPLGAPVRVDIDLRNTGEQPLPAPVDLSLKAGHVHGTVTDPSGTVRQFRPLIRCIEEERLAELDAGEPVTSSLTLLRGPEGALFPMAGPYTIRVEAEWDIDGVPLRVAGTGSVMVTPPVDAEHAEAALRVMSTPDTLLTLALGGDHLPEGVEAVEAALDSAVLRPHFAYIEAKRVATRFFDRSPDLGRAAELLDESTVMSAAEVDKASRIVAAAKERGDEPPAELVDVLRGKADETGADAARRTLEDL
jgi:hypothetical protein